MMSTDRITRKLIGFHRKGGGERSGTKVIERSIRIIRRSKQIKRPSGGDDDDDDDDGD
jgi:hypothetical protein